MVLVPFQVGLVFFAGWWIPKLFGLAWVSLVPVYQVMAVYGLARSFFDDVPPLVTLGFKNPWALMKNQIVQSIVILVFGPLVVMKFGAVGGAAVVTGAMILGTILFWRLVLNKIRCGKKRFLALGRSACRVTPAGR